MSTCDKFLIAHTCKRGSEFIAYPSLVSFCLLKKTVAIVLTLATRILNYMHSVLKLGKKCNLAGQCTVCLNG